jgi:hypothetical protein
VLLLDPVLLLHCLFLLKAFCGIVLGAMPAAGRTSHVCLFSTQYMHQGTLLSMGRSSCDSAGA